MDLSALVSSRVGHETDSWYRIGTPELNTYERAKCYQYTKKNSLKIVCKQGVYLVCIIANFAVARQDNFGQQQFRLSECPLECFPSKLLTHQTDVILRFPDKKQKPLSLIH